MILINLLDTETHAPLKVDSPDAVFAVLTELHRRMKLDGLDEASHVEAYGAVIGAMNTLDDLVFLREAVASLPESLRTPASEDDDDE